MKPLHGFLQDSKFYEDLGHILLGLAPLGLLLWAREWTAWRMPWPMSGQWPPGKPAIATAEFDGDIVTSAQPMTQLSRVSDVGRDELGYRIGATIRNVGLLVWWAIC